MKQGVSIKRAREVLQVEAESILKLIDKLDDHFTRAVESIYHCKGRVIVTGIGKSGLIGKKIAAHADQHGNTGPLSSPRGGPCTATLASSPKMTS